jgi:hypothetical protein
MSCDGKIKDAPYQEFINPSREGFGGVRADCSLQQTVVSLEGDPMSALLVPYNPETRKIELYAKPVPSIRFEEFIKLPDIAQRSLRVTRPRRAGMYCPNTKQG